MPSTKKVPNLCHGAVLEKREYPTTFPAVFLPFSPSVKQLTTYALSQGQKLVMDYQGEAPRVTFDETARRRLMLKYKTDPLYPLVDQWHEINKCLGTYVNGLHMGADDRVHETFTHNPETLRLAMQILQTLPRPDDLEDPPTLLGRVRSLFIAPPGHLLLSRDFSSIEPQLVGYLAGDQHFLKLCKAGLHDFVTCHAVGVTPDAAWDIPVLQEFYAKTKQDTGLEYRKKRPGCKTAGMLSLYAGGAGEMYRRRPDVFENEADARWYQELILGVEGRNGRRSGGLFPLISQWHWRVAEETERHGYIQAPSGFRLLNMDTIAYTSVRDPETGKKTWKKALARAAKESIAAVPQHLAMCYMAAAIRRAWADPLLAPCLRLSIHDELLLDTPLEVCDKVDSALKDAMEQPLDFMPLPSEWDMGDRLVISTAGKRGTRWSALA